MEVERKGDADWFWIEGYKGRWSFTIDSKNIEFDYCEEWHGANTSFDTKELYDLLGEVLRKTGRIK